MMWTQRILLLVVVAMVSSVSYGQPYLGSSQPRPMALRNLDMGRSFDDASSGTINEKVRVPKPEIISKTEWGGGESSGTMRSHFPSSLTVHHQGSPRPLSPDDDPQQGLRNLQKWGWSDRGWPDLPYHYLLDLDGNIYEGRDVMKVGDTNTAYNPAGKLLITLMGNTDIQAPTKAQLDSMVDLMAWASDYYNIDPATVRGHMEYTPTGCPGKYLYPFVVSGFFEGQIRQKIAEAYRQPEPASAEAPAP